MNKQEFLHILSECGCIIEFSSNRQYILEPVMRNGETLFRCNADSIPNFTVEGINHQNIDMIVERINLFTRNN